MHVYGILTCVLATALTCETAWNGNHGDFGFYRPHDWRGPFGPQRPHGPYGSYGFHGPFGSHRPYGSHGPHGPHNFHPPHHEYQLPHHEPCDWFRGGGSKDHWQKKPSRPPPTTPSTASTSISVPNPKKSLDCALDCLTFTNPDDNNPVCGSNGVTYRNDMTLKCVRDCGEDVTLVQRHKCDKVGGGSTIGTSTSIPPKGPELDSILTCMLRCPTTPEYNPVCGSDGLTYANPGRVECAKMCGRDVEVSKYTRCPTGDITPKSNTNATPNPNTNATPNSNTNATPNPNSNATTNPEPVTTPPPITNVTPKHNTPPVTPANPPDFTIPQDILDQIFTKNYNNLIDVRRNKNK